MFGASGRKWWPFPLLYEPAERDLSRADLASFMALIYAQPSVAKHLKPFISPGCYCQKLKIGAYMHMAFLQNGLAVVSLHRCPNTFVCGRTGQFKLLFFNPVGAIMFNSSQIFETPHSCKFHPA